ncbi:MAG: DUF4197 domain-containing protein [Flavobacteriales bacterium]|nr:DUF4197 domain-containing protein [Flavobacteriales bacterium]
MIKRSIFPILLVFSFLSTTFYSCDQIVDLVEDFLSEGDATEALKEALRVGTDTSVTSASALDGYFANELIKILLPPEANVIVGVIDQVPGIGPALIDEVVLKLNRAAEDAAPQAKNILWDAIIGITITDAIAIVNGSNTAATQYLQAATQDSINLLFRPHIENSLNQVGAQSAWNSLTSNYNTVAPLLGKPQVNTDLAGYTTNEASNGLFKLVAEEEKKIREDPVHRVTEILEKVFGNGN